MLNQKYQSHNHENSHPDDLDNFTICLFKTDEIWQENTYSNTEKLDKET
jgi:hypothetical protein